MMGLIGNTFRALGRLRHGKGFGIHSPFAYMFVREVLRLPDKYGYYAYHEIAYRHREWEDVLTKDDAVALKYLKMIFRIGNFFRSDRVIVSGTGYPLVVMATTLLCENCRVALFGEENNEVRKWLTKSYARKKQISLVETVAGITDFLDESEETGRPLIIIAGDCSDTTEQLLDSEVMKKDPVYIVLNLKRNRMIWDRITSAYTNCGMSFSNPQAGVMVPDRGLPRQHFSLWI